MPSMRLFYAVIWVVLPSLLCGQNLMPWPRSVRPGGGALTIDKDFSVAIQGHQEPRLRAAVDRLTARLAKQTGLALTAAANPKLVVECKAAGEDEAYTLDVTPQAARIAAAQTVGALRGIETFLQLVEGSSVAAVHIEDSPRFPWRGLLIDASRHWMPVDVIKRNLDGMAAVKLNVLHWHLSDDQGFRVESRIYPRLQRLGSDGSFYTQKQIREIIEYARERGIRVVPEFDVPGHTLSWFPGYPQLAAIPGKYSIGRTWGFHDPEMDPTSGRVYTFLDRFIGEMAKLFPDPYFHIGGDEVSGKQWDRSRRIRRFKRAHHMKTNHDLQVYFNKRLNRIVARHGKKMVGWDEILHPGLPKNIVVQSWRGQKSLAEAAKQGYTGILSYGYYLDLIRPASAHYAIDPLGDAAASLDAAAQARILGGEACMWAEFVTAETVDSRIWPRLAAVAERLWSAQDVTDVASMYARLDAVSAKLERLGLTHRTGSAAMLRTLAAGQPIEPLLTLDSVLEPVKGYARTSARKYTSLMPLDRLVDATPPESNAAREFGQLVDALLAGKLDSQEPLRRNLTLWRDNHARFSAGPALEEAVPLSEDLAALSTVALEAIDAIINGKRPGQDWIDRQRAMLDRAAKPRAELLIMIAPQVQKLVEAAATR